MTMRKNKSKKYSVIKYKGLEEEMSLLGFFCKKVVGAFAFEVIICTVKFVSDGKGEHKEIANYSCLSISVIDT